MSDPVFICVGLVALIIVSLNVALTLEKMGAAKTDLFGQPREVPPSEARMRWIILAFWLLVAAVVVAVLLYFINPEAKDIFSFKLDDFELIGYDPHPTIKAEVSV